MDLFTTNPLPMQGRPYQPMSHLRFDIIEPLGINHIIMHFYIKGVRIDYTHVDHGILNPLTNPMLPFFFYNVIFLDNLFMNVSSI